LQLSLLIVQLLGNGDVDVGLLADAISVAQLAKTDLVTDMVGEFPELQGTMGRYYALNDDLSAEVADAIEDHYKPRFAGDDLPRNKVGIVVALADKLETLVGMFGVGNLPTGDKDPFALRRHALGVIRILIERDLPVSLDTLLQSVAGSFGKYVLSTGPEPSVKPKDSSSLSVGPAFNTDTPELVANFIYDRLAGSLREQGYSAQEVESVVSMRPQRLGDIPKRLAAVRAFAALPQAPALAAANKRIGNILKKADGVVDAAINDKLLIEPAEITLADALKSIAPRADQAWADGQYAENLQALAGLKGPVDAFFDNVMVNAEDPALKANRLGLLATLHAAMNRVADLSKLAS
jgi:glycyl-tRNA synthetase beta chain